MDIVDVATKVMGLYKNSHEVYFCHFLLNLEHHRLITPTEKLLFKRYIDAELMTGTTTKDDYGRPKPVWGTLSAVWRCDDRYGLSADEPINTHTSRAARIMWLQDIIEGKVRY